MPIIAQGLRRSGTTIIYDIISQDKRIPSYYEPLSLGRPSMGGGSKATLIDVSEGTRKVREEFCIKNKIKLNHSDFNLGAPTNYRLESQKIELPLLIRQYINYILSKNNNSFLKFTRASFLINELHELSPNSLFLHIIKNPARWVASHICVRYGNDRSKDPEIFLNLKEGYNGWSQENISNFIINKYKPEYLDKPAYFKLLYLWKFLNKKIEKDAYKLYNQRYIKICNDELHNDYKVYLDKIYKHLNLHPDEKIYRWCNENIKAPKDILFKNDERWRKAFNELGIDLRWLN